MEKGISITISSESLQEQITAIQELLDSNPEHIILTIKGEIEK